MHQGLTLHWPAASFPVQPTFTLIARRLGKLPPQVLVWEIPERDLQSPYVGDIEFNIRILFNEWFVCVSKSGDISNMHSKKL